MAGSISKRFDTSETTKKYVHGILVYSAYIGEGKKADYRMVCSNRDKLKATIGTLKLLKDSFDTEIRPLKMTDENGEVLDEYSDVIVEEFLSLPIVCDSKD